jgi:hypothetical protein
MAEAGVVALTVLILFLRDYQIFRKSAVCPPDP